MLGLVRPQNPAVVAHFQIGVAMLVRPSAERRLHQRTLWKGVVATNGVILSVFVLHMTALLLAVFIYERLGGSLIDEPILAWWLQRPLWILLPAVFPAMLVTIFSRVETMRPPLRRARR